MKISTRGRYGLRLLLDLAEHSEENHVSLGEIAERQHISARYLEQVAVLLRRAGYIRSVKGASGGYALTRDPGGIIIGDVLRVLEGDMLLVDDLRPGETETKIQKCIRTVVYNRLNQQISDVVDRISLSSLIGSKDCEDAYMYYI